MRLAQRLKTLLLTETLLAVARIFSKSAVVTKAPTRAEVIMVTMRLLAAKLGSYSIETENGFTFMFAGTKFGGGTWKETADELSLLDPLVTRLLQPALEPDTSRFERAVWLTQLYEQTLDFDLEEVDGELRIVDWGSGKKRMGQFYTPLSLARRTASTAFIQLFSHGAFDSIEKLARLKILDPAMGGGIFILCALECLEQHLNKINGELPVLTLAGCLYGTDIDPLSCEIAPLALWLYCASNSELQPRAINNYAKNFKHADALLSSWACLLKSVDSQAESEKVFLWDSEFPSVFTPEPELANVTQGKTRKIELYFDNSPPGNEKGFDLVISNPPWELARPNSQEFFVKTSPDFRRLTKQEAIIHSEKLLSEKKSLKNKWQQEQSEYQNKAAFIRQLSSCKPHPAGTSPLAARPLFAAQGESDLNVYKLFLDLGFALLKKDGCMAMIVPSGVLTDKGAYQLRRLFLNEGRLYCVETFTNLDHAFPIHPSFAYSILGAQKDGTTSDIRVKFDQQSNLQFSYQQKDISILSPKWLTIFDVSHPKDLEILKKLHNHGPALGDTSKSGLREWNLKFKREYDMTNDSHLFKTVHLAEEEGFRADAYGNWLKGRWEKNEEKSNFDVIPGIVPSADYQSAIKLENIEDVLLPLYEGRMIGQFDYSQKIHLTGSGRTALWRQNPEYEAEDGNLNLHLSNLLQEHSKSIRPHYLVQTKAKSSFSLERQIKTGYLAVGSATNVRTMLASALFMVPCGNSVPTFTSPQGLAGGLGLTACLNSFVFDYALRMRMTGNNLNYFLLQECPLPEASQIYGSSEIIALTAGLNLNHVRNAAQWLELASINPDNLLFATSKFDRLKMRSTLDALIASAYGLTIEEYEWMLRGCDRKSTRASVTRQDVKGIKASRRLSSRGATATQSMLHTKGFWREGKNQPPELRLPVAALDSYRTLLQDGLSEFIKQTNRLQHAQVNEPSLQSLSTLSNNLQVILER